MDYTITVESKERKIINIDHNFYLILLIMLLFVIFRHYNITKLNFILISLSGFFVVLNPIYGLMLYLFSAAFEAYFINPKSRIPRACPRWVSVVPRVTLSRVFEILFLVIMFLQILRRRTKINRELMFFIMLILFVVILSAVFSLSLIPSLYEILLHLLEMGILIGMVYLPANNKHLIKCIDITCLFSLFLLCFITWLNVSSSGYYNFRLSICAVLGLS